MKSTAFNFDNHAPITIEIQTKKYFLIKGSEEEVLFINKLIHSIANTNTSHLLYTNNLETIVQRIAYDIKNLQQKHSKVVYITKRSKVW